ncbi:MAG: hypothetical protein AAF750_15505 [Planctomycetota bacterium]
MPRLLPSTFRDVRSVERTLGQELSPFLTRSTADTLYSHLRTGKREFARRAAGRFKNKSKRVGQWVALYSKGQTLDTLELGVFTRWNAGELYEQGGTITPKGRWLVVPISKRVLTPLGRVKRRFRDPKTGHFTEAFWKDTVLVPSSEGLLVIRPVKANRRGALRTRNRSGTTAATSGGHASELVAILVRNTRRKPTLGFYDFFTRHLNQADITPAHGRALRAAARAHRQRTAR